MTRPRRAYVDQPVSDLAAATRAAATAAEAWRLETPHLHRAGMNVIFTTGAVVLRVSAPNADAHVSLELADFWSRRSVPVPKAVRDDVVVADGLSVTAWERIDDTGTPIDWSRVGAIVRQVHETDPRAVPRAVPLPSPTAFPWWDFDALLERAAPALDDAARDGLVAAIERHPRWHVSDQAVVCHGDVHPGNVLMRPDGPVLLDWDLLCLAPAGWDHAPMMTWAQRWGGEPGEYDAFAAATDALCTRTRLPWRLPNCASSPPR